MKFLSHLLCLSATIFCINTAQSQIRNLKLYSEFLIFSNHSLGHFDDEPKAFAYNGLSLGYSKTRENLFFTQLTGKFYLQRKQDGSQPIRRIGGIVQIEYGLTSKRKLLSLFRTRYGQTTSAFYQHETAEGGGSNFEFDFTGRDFGITTSLFGAIEYDLSDRISLDAILNILYFRFFVDYRRIENPAWTQRQQQQGSLNIDLFQQRMLRVGLSYRL